MIFAHRPTGIVNLLGFYTVCQSCGMDTLPVTITDKNHRFPVEILSHAVWLYFLLPEFSGCGRVTAGPWCSGDL
jgi:hypothetical protein